MPIVIYNYTPPPPMFNVISVSPGNRQTFQQGQLPKAVAVSFTQPIDPARSELKVYDAYNRLVVTKLSQAKNTDLLAELPEKLLSETYRVDYKATCACSGNPAVNGSSYFTVY